MSTTKVGNAFRDEVAQLLELIPQISNVQTEHRIGSQDVDIYYEERTSTGTQRVACECKNYAKPLIRSKIATEIYPRYNPLRDDGLVDAIRIIAPLVLGSDAQQYLRDCRFSFTTRDDLESSLIDFRAYLHSLRALYREGGLDRYYIRPILEDQRDLEDRVKAWLDEDSSQPIAILAGYGMGKTSFARRLARVMADAHSNSSANRIPILIPLADISSEQSLDGLLGKLFTAQNAVAGYHFGLFMALNRRGRFLVILDGFDEMKHTMSWGDFRHNITELHRLVTPRSKVILLGRPNALLSEVEELFVLKGARKEREKILAIPGAPEYIELSLQPFTEEQALGFINGYAAYRADNDAAVRANIAPPDEVSRRLEDIRRDQKLQELIVRPVQAKMIADLAIDPNAEWRSFSRYELYNEFVSRIIFREALKPTRKAFSEEQRRGFIEAVAWWQWRKAGVGFDVTELPKEIVGGLIGEDIEGDEEGATRDLLAGSLLERKTGEKYYFPHRSFLEFLVARHIATSEWDTRNLGEVSDALNPEIVAFLKESGQHLSFAAWGALIEQIEGLLSLRFIELVAWAQNASARSSKEPRPDAHSTPGQILLNYLRLSDSSAAPMKILSYLVDSFVIAVQDATKLMCLTALLLLRESAIVDFRARIGRLVAASVLNEALPQIVRATAQAPRSRLGASTDLFTELVTSTMRGHSASSGAFVLHVEWQELFTRICEELPPQWRLQYGSLEIEDEQITFADLGAHARALRLSEKGGYVLKFLRR